MSNPHHRIRPQLRPQDILGLPSSLPAINAPSGILGRQDPEVGEDLRQRVVSRRVPLQRRILLKLADIHEPIIGQTVNLAMTGVFVRSQVLTPLGTGVAFELDLADGQQPIRGRGKVAWVRSHPEGRRRPRGLGLRFARLENSSRARLEQTVETELLQKGSVRDLDELLAMSREPLSPGIGAGTDGQEAVPDVDRQQLHLYAGTAAAKTEGWSTGQTLLALAGGLITLALASLILLW